MDRMFAIRRRALAGLAAAALALGTAPAQAAVRYELQSQVYDNVIPGRFSGGSPQPTTGLTFTVSDAAVMRGTFVIGHPGNSGATTPTRFTGDVADFISLRVGEDRPFTPTFVFGNFDLRASFAPGGSVTDFFLDVNGDGEATRFRSLGGNLIGGGYGSDRGFVCGPNGGGDGSSISGFTCGLAGRIEVPEPASMTLLGFGLLGIAAVRRRA